MSDKVISKEIGYAAETAALRYLEVQGLKLLERNVEACGAEVDLIMEDGEAWVFVEVRARENYRDVHPLETIDRKKQLKIIRVAKFYLCQAECYQTRAARFDAVAVCLGTGEIEWVRDAFTL